MTDPDGDTGASVRQVTVTVPPVDDSDGDGIHDDEERSGPNDGDGNRDGIEDSQQDGVTSIRGNDGAFITIEVDEESRLEKVTIVDTPTDVPVPEGVTFPMGMIELEVHDLGDDGGALVTIHLDDEAEFNTLFLWGPTPDNSTPHWHPFLFAGETGARLFANRIEINFVDGALGDIDLSVDGLIRTSIAPGMSDHPWQNPWQVGDVNRDGTVTPRDALEVINYLGLALNPNLPLVPEGVQPFAPVFYDVSGDQLVSPLDALRVINILANQAASGLSEGVSSTVLSNNDSRENRLQLVDDAIGQLF